MFLKCPGQGQKQVSAEILRCPSCGYDAEIFSDELKTKCPACACLLRRERMPSCLDWCKAASLCAGAELLKNRKGGN